MATNYLDKTGLGTLWGKIKALSDVVIVTVRGSSADGVVTYTADKTYAELKTAKVEGKMVILKYQLYYFYLWTGPTSASSTNNFVFGTLECGNTYYFTISKDDVVEKKDLQSVRTVNGRTGNVTLTYSDVGALPDSTVIPANVSDLNNDSGYQTQAQVENAINSARTMVVRITWDSTNSKYVSDKTFAEIYNAFNNDTNIVAIIDFLTVCDLINCYYDSEYGTGSATFCSASIYGVDGEVCVDGTYIDIQAENANLEETITINVYPGNAFIPVGSTNVDVPLMDGTAYNGDSLKFARADHIHPSDTTKANVSDVLTKTNTTAYTPTSTYHPATKGYVDGLIPANVSDLNNDAGYQTQAQVENAIAQSSDVVIVKVKRNGATEYTADKTYAELRTAMVEGKTVILRYTFYHFYTWRGPVVATATYPFVFGTLVGGNTYYFTISNDDVVEIHDLQSVRTVNGQTGDITLTYSDVGALPDSTVIPTKVSDLNNDSGFQTQAQVNALIAAASDDDTTYAISISGNVITLTGSDGNTSTVTLPVYTGGVV